MPYPISKSYASARRVRGQTGGVIAGLAGVLVLLVAVAGPAAATILTISGQTMEGDLQLPSGSTVGAGYDVNGPAGTTLTVSSGVVDLHFACSQNGPAVGTLSLAFPDYTVKLGGSGWYPSGDQQSAAVWQVPNQSVASATSTCHGGPVWVNSHTGGASYVGDFTSSPAGAKVSVRFHYRETNPHSTSGSWSATDSVTTASVTTSTSTTASTTASTSPPSCPAGTTMQSNGSCTSPPTCPAGTTMQSNGSCTSPPSCPAGTTMQSNGSCTSPAGQTKCPAGSTMQSNGSCTSPPSCPAGTTMQSNGSCTSPPSCPAGATMQSNGSCASPPSVLGEQLSQAPGGGVATGGGGTSHRGYHLPPLGVGLGCVGLVSFVTRRRRRRVG